MSPAWSPDGRKLAYVSFENGQSQVFVQELRTGAQTPRVGAQRRQQRASLVAGRAPAGAYAVQG